MPYTRKGRCVFRSDTGAKVGCSKTVPEAKQYLQVLNMREHGVAKKPATPKGKR